MSFHTYEENKFLMFFRWLKDLKVMLLLFFF